MSLHLHRSHSGEEDSDEQRGVMFSAGVDEIDNSDEGLEIKAGASDVESEVDPEELALKRIRVDKFKQQRYSKPFLENDDNGVGVVFIDDDPELPNSGNYHYDETCQLCHFYDDFCDQLPTSNDGDKWGILHYNVQHAANAQNGTADEDDEPRCMCEEHGDEHAYHVRCIRAYVVMHRSKFEIDPRCPLDAGWILPHDAPVLSASESSYWESDEEPMDLRNGEDKLVMLEAGVTKAKKQKHKTKQIYQCVVHIIEAKDLRMPGDGEDAPKPVVSVASSAFDANFKTGHTGVATFRKVWDTPYPFQKKILEEDFNDATIEIAVHSHNAWWMDTLLGKIVLQAKVVNQQPNHEFYRRWEVLLAPDGSIAGKVQFSCVVFSEEDFVANPYLPIHIYDLEVAMWDEIINEGEGESGTLADLNDDAFLDNAIAGDALPETVLHGLLFKFFQAQYIPKCGTFGWADTYIEIDNSIAKRPDWGNRSLKTDVVIGDKHPVWNSQLGYTLYSLDPTVVDVTLVVKSRNTILADDVIGKVKIDLRHIIAQIKQDGKSVGPFWKNVYQDIDGEAPTFRGQIYFSISLVENIKDPMFQVTPLEPAQCPEPFLSPCKLEIEMFEGVHLYGNEETYSIDVTMGHNLCYEGRKDNGMIWETFVADNPDKKYEGITHISTKRTVYFDAPEADGKVVNDSTRGVHASLRATKVEDGGVDESRVVYKQNNTVATDTRSQFPDIIIYVTKGRQPRGYRPQKDDIIGYFRIPVNGMVRPTEARAESATCGGDLTIFHGLWTEDNQPETDPDTGEEMPVQETGRCLQLKEVVELYEGTPGFIAMKLKMSWLTPEEEQERLDAFEDDEPMEDIVEEPLRRLERVRYNFASNILQAKNIAGDPDTGLSNAHVVCELMNLSMKTQTKHMTNYPMWMETLKNWNPHEVATTLALENKVNTTPVKKKTKKKTKKNKKNKKKKESEMTEEEKAAAGDASTEEEEEEEESDSEESSQDEEEDKAEEEEGFVTELYLPEESCYIPDVKYMIYHQEQGGTDVSFRGKVEIPAYFSQDGEGSDGVRELSALQWYPIMHEDLPCGELLATFFLCPVKDQPGTAVEPYDPHSYVPGPDDWEVWSVDVVGLALRGDIGVDFDRRGVQPTYVLDAGFNEVKTIHQRDADGQLNIKVRKHPDAIYFSCVQCRAYDGDDLHAITVIPANVILKSKVGWYKVLDQFMNMPDNAARTVLRKWRKFLPISEQGMAEVDDDWADDGDEVDEEDPEQIEAAKIHAEKVAKKLAGKSRTFDENGDADFDAEQMEEIELPDFDEKKERLMEHPYFRHWRVQTNYEALPMVKNPFAEFQLHPAKADFLDGLVQPSREVIGVLRGNFQSTQLTTVGDAKLSHPPKNSFDKGLYQEPGQYAVRIYVCQARQLLIEANKEKKIFITMQVGHQAIQRIEPQEDGSVNPKFYQRADFNNVLFPDPYTILTISVWNHEERTFGYDEDVLVGTTKISLENRLFNKEWQAGRRPLEYRPLFNDKRGRMPQGKIEVCLDVVPQAHAGLPGPPMPVWPLDYLLDPPQREPWQLRVTIHNTRNIINKNINIAPDASCCTKICSLPNHSHLWCFSMMLGNDDVLCKTDTHQFAYDGAAVFNCRHLHEVKLPSPKPHATLKLSVWHDQGFFSLNDDCLCEVAIPLWNFFEISRKAYENFRAQDGKSTKDEQQGVFKLGRRWISLSHPHNDNTGDIEIELELVPKELLDAVPALVAAGDNGLGDAPTPEKSWDPNENAHGYCLVDPTPLRPDESNIPWYRYDQKLMFRASFIFKNLLPYLIVCGILLLAAAVGMAFYYNDLKNQVLD